MARLASGEVSLASRSEPQLHIPALRAYRPQGWLLRQSPQLLGDDVQRLERLKAGSGSRAGISPTKARTLVADQHQISPQARSRVSHTLPLVAAAIAVIQSSECAVAAEYQSLPQQRITQTLQSLLTSQALAVAEMVALAGIVSIVFGCAYKMPRLSHFGLCSFSIYLLLYYSVWFGLAFLLFVLTFLRRRGATEES